MQQGKFNIVIDQAWGSSGKGKISTWLADQFNVTEVSSSNFPNAGHTAEFEDGTKFVSKAIPTSAILKKVNGMNINCYISPGSGFNWERVVKEWKECGKPKIYIHGRASIVTDSHAAREREGKDSTKHVASTMQGSGAAISDKILRRPDCKLAWNDEENFRKAFSGHDVKDIVSVVDPLEFRNLTRSIIGNGKTWLHEGSQGYALSIDHGSHYPNCTSRNCTSQMAMDQMAIPGGMVGDTYLNLRTLPIRVGNVVEDGKEVGYSGDFYDDCQELTWEEVGRRSGMPQEESEKLLSRELTTVTKRLRRVSTFSWIGLKDAVETNGVTKICINFIQYLNWKDAGIKGERKALFSLSKKSRSFIEKIEEVSQVPVVLIGTGAKHEEIINLL